MNSNVYDFHHCRSEMDSTFPTALNNSKVVTAKAQSFRKPNSYLEAADPITMKPVLADIESRRYIMDSVLHRGELPNYKNRNTLYMMNCRSGGSTVRDLIESINEKCDQQQNRGEDMQDDTMEQGRGGVFNMQTPEQDTLHPLRECCILARWSADSYYQVVIAGKRGIPAIIRAMIIFSCHRGIQECCCLTLGNLCVCGDDNVASIRNAGGIRAILCAMKAHPDSVAVQTAACDALRNMSGSIRSHGLGGEDPSTSRSDVASVADREEFARLLIHARDVCYFPVYQQIAGSLLHLLRDVATPPTSPPTSMQR